MTKFKVARDYLLNEKREILYIVEGYKTFVERETEENKSFGWELRDVIKKETFKEVIDKSKYEKLSEMFKVVDCIRVESEQFIEDGNVYLEKYYCNLITEDYFTKVPALVKISEYRKANKRIPAKYVKLLNTMKSEIEKQRADFVKANVNLTMRELKNAVYDIDLSLDAIELNLNYAKTFKSKKQKA